MQVRQEEKHNKSKTTIYWVHNIPNVNILVIDRCNHLCFNLQSTSMYVILTNFHYCFSVYWIRHRCWSLILMHFNERFFRLYNIIKQGKCAYNVIFNLNLHNKIYNLHFIYDNEDAVIMIIDNDIYIFATYI